jgi:hypothetical protein
VGYLFQVDVLLLLEFVLDVMMHYYYKVKVILYAFYFMEVFRSPP